MRRRSMRICSRPLYSCTVPRTLITAPCLGGCTVPSHILQLISPVVSHRVRSRYLPPLEEVR